MLVHPLSGEYVAAQVDKNSIRIDLEIKVPKKVKKQLPVPQPAPAVAVPRGPGAFPISLLSTMFQEQKTLEPSYFQNVDCVGLPEILTATECRQVIDFAEGQGFHTQRRGHALDFQWCDVVDPSFADAIWNTCGLECFLRQITIDGMVPCGLNEVIRIQKYVEGSRFGRHTDQSVKRQDGRVSKYSLRIFLNGKEEQWFVGGLSAFYIPARQEPVVFEPETGLGLLYPQGERCVVQEETEVTSGCKYVLRADVLFCRTG
jgi:hypothetical protein